ncbi:hypothetical protein T11_11538 [Trichinella zimbabwensis]|uniref:Uncharacterized protein n=1 Tax=Trichinella zimbabwensis TaxID=268475 RepID=A0A0V1GST0_9BILA|nr:hypothetical protein T11_11538 [Trichinella zimbabwensis]
MSAKKCASADSSKIQRKSISLDMKLQVQQFLGQYDQELIELHGGSLSNEDLNVLWAHNGPAVDESE